MDGEDLKWKHFGKGFSLAMLIMCLITFLIIHLEKDFETKEICQYEFPHAKCELRWVIVDDGEIK